MRQGLELVDHGEYFPKSIQPKKDDDEDEGTRLFKVERVGAVDFVLCGQDNSILYRQVEGVQPVAFPHDKEQMLNFKMYKDRTWILVVQKVGSSTLGLVIMDMTTIEKLGRFMMEETLTSTSILVYEDYLLAIKQNGVFAYDMQQITKLVKSNNIKSYSPRLIFAIKNGKDMCVEEDILFVVCERSNLLHRVELGQLGNLSVAKLGFRSSQLISDEFVTENYITNPKVKSLDKDVVVCTTNKLVLLSTDGKSQDQYSMTQMIDMCVLKHGERKFVLALHRREDISILRVHNQGFFVISRFFCLEPDRTPFTGILHLHDLHFVVYGEVGYCKRFELKFNLP